MLLLLLPLLLLLLLLFLLNQKEKAKYVNQSQQLPRRMKREETGMKDETRETEHKD